MVACSAMRRVAVVLALLLALVGHGADATYIKVKQNNAKCFIEVIAANQVYMIIYKSPDQESLPMESEAQKYHVGLMFQVISNRGKVFEQRLDKEGRVAFTSPNNGEHRLCFSVEGHSLGHDFRVHMELITGLEHEDHSKLVTRETFSAMELKVRRMSDDIKRVQKEQEYMRGRDESMFRTSLSTNSRAQWLSVGQIAGMGAVTFGYCYYLRLYFTAKKLV
mmetsp:Transcript_65893/g.157225  ORF Transcript_65893/g.157225 Transcript_65893/m.157225 type:complete len:221 (+) Transcript_65893:158-820(+)